MFYLFTDPLFLVVMLVGGGLCGIAAMRVKSTFAKYQRVGVRSGMTGAEAARAVCRAGGVDDVTIERHHGFLSDHYDPRSRTLRLSPDVYDGRSISSIAVAAHEAGHAIQHKQAYVWLGMRSTLVPLVGVANGLWTLPFFLGLVLGGFASNGIGGPLMVVGAALLGIAVLFQLVTLPVEFDASNRAKAVLAHTGIVSTPEEARGVSDVLGAAALTYVAGAVSSALTLAYVLFRIAGSRN
ncbi:MAG: zinc metallopeptidase [Planctomycetota bacterium]